MEINLYKYYVYAHSVKRKIFYVGCGKMARATHWDLRGDYWFKVVESNNGIYKSKILGIFDKRKDALEFEAEQIHKLRPIANRMMPKITKKKANLIYGHK